MVLMVGSVCSVMYLLGMNAALKDRVGLLEENGRLNAGLVVSCSHMVQMLQRLTTAESQVILTDMEYLGLDAERAEFVELMEDIGDGSVYPFRASSVVTAHRLPAPGPRCTGVGGGE